MRPRNIDKLNLINVDSEDLTEILCYALKKAALDGPDALRPVRNFIKEHRRDLNEETLRKLRRASDEVDLKKLPPENHDYFTDISYYIILRLEYEDGR